MSWLDEKLKGQMCDLFGSFSLEAYFLNVSLEFICN